MDKAVQIGVGVGLVVTSLTIALLAQWSLPFFVNAWSGETVNLPNPSAKLVQAASVLWVAPLLLVPLLVDVIRRHQPSKLYQWVAWMLAILMPIALVAWLVLALTLPIVPLA